MIAPFVFCGVKHLISLATEFFEMHRLGRPNSAETDGDRDICFIGGHGNPRNDRAAAFGNIAGLFACDVGEHKEEFIPAHPAKDILRANAQTNTVRDVLQDLITCVERQPPCPVATTTLAGL